MVNYWIILCLFSILGLVLPSDNSMPKSWSDFLESIVLLHSYNGAWWYLKTYIILLLIPTGILLVPVNRVKPLTAVIVCAVLQIGWYLFNRFYFFTVDNFVGARLWTELSNLIFVLPYFWVGALLCRINVFEQAAVFLNRCRKPKILLSIILVALFVGSNIIHKALLMPWVAVAVFLLFNLWAKGNISKRIFMFLGKHSTNIWLTHMFFYLCVFPGLVQKAQYPVLMLAFMLVLTIASSYVILGIQKNINSLFAYVK